MEVLFVGTADAFGAGGRRHAAILVRAGGGAVLLDCGGTTVSGLAALGVARDAIDAILVTHYHADHFGGVTQFLLACAYRDERRRPLVVAGPPGVERRVREAAAALGHPLADLTRPLEVRFVDLGDHPRELGPVRVCAFPVRHAPEASPHGLDVRDGGTRVVYTGDTAWFEDLPAAARGADLFICDGTFLDPAAGDHLSYRELLSRRDGFDCGRIVLTHLGEEMAAHRGRLEIDTADDGMVVWL